MNRNTWILREGRAFIAIFLGILVLYLLVKGLWLGIALLALFIWCTAFFRNPPRETPSDPGLVIAPADGEIVGVQIVEDDRFLHKKMLRISIFMSVFNVHVNRAPATGKVREVIYNPGKYLVAKNEKASLDNEQNALILDLEDGSEIVVNQIAGLVARRIVCYATPGTFLQRGERFGLIRFGSRVDIYVPETWEPQVAEGIQAFGGETVLAKNPAVANAAVEGD